MSCFCFANSRNFANFVMQSREVARLSLLTLSRRKNQKIRRKMKVLKFIFKGFGILISLTIFKG